MGTITSNEAVLKLMFTTQQLAKFNYDVLEKDLLEVVHVPLIIVKKTDETTINVECDVVSNDVENGQNVVTEIRGGDVTSDSNDSNVSQVTVFDVGNNKAEIKSDASNCTIVVADDAKTVTSASALDIDNSNQAGGQGKTVKLFCCNSVNYSENVFACLAFQLTNHRLCLKHCIIILPECSQLLLLQQKCLQLWPQASDCNVKVIEQSIAIDMGSNVPFQNDASVTRGGGVNDLNLMSRKETIEKMREFLRKGPKKCKECEKGACLIVKLKQTLQD